MRSLAAVLGAALLLAPVMAWAQPAEHARDGGGCAQHQAEFGPLIGRSEAEARAALERMPGIRAIRVGGPNTPMAMDHQPDRVTALVRDGRVERIGCG